ncbi:cannabinoid receptor 2 [Colossoma macropomum]|uniref:cannabinoid receptor 2 n=1 Tax=Colossoma macropomum TaxID=42526 RepID=UPI001863ACEC|nr:cannabinoid receptor 2 [Colossoma macropomum]XP_036412212.1 cannabinoid receptor 2 [Colossoma macropomum]
MATEQNEVTTALTDHGALTTTGGNKCENLSCYLVLSETEKHIIKWICCITGPATFLENILVLVVIGASARLRKRPSYLFIGSLAVADVLASSFFPIFFLEFHLLGHIDNSNIYLFKLGGVTMAFTGSVGSLLLTSMDRYLCIYKAPRYKLLLTRRRALFGIVALWTVTIVISFLPPIGWRCQDNPPCSQLFPYVDPHYMSCWAGLMLVVLVLILVAYALILWKAHHHEAVMEARTPGRSTMGQRDRMRVDIRLARTLGLILLILVLCWVPSLTIMVVDVSRKLTRKEQRVFAFCGTLCLVNSAVNPLLYALRCRELRRALLNLLRRVCRVCTWGTGMCASGQKKDNDTGHAENKDKDTISESLDRQHLD